jgi:hypothetical protein
MLHILKGKNTQRAEKWCLFDDNHGVAYFFSEEQEKKLAEKIADDFAQEFAAREISEVVDNETREKLHVEYNFTLNDEFVDSLKMESFFQKVKNLLY